MYANQGYYLKKTASSWIFFHLYNLQQNRGFSQFISPITEKRLFLKTLFCCQVNEGRVSYRIATNPGIALIKALEKVLEIPFYFVIPSDSS